MKLQQHEMGEALDPITLSQVQNRTTQEDGVIPDRFMINYKHKMSPSMTLFFKLIIGIVLGWAFSFLLICFLDHWSLADLSEMSEDTFRLIAFIAFPMGAIIGGGFVLALHKSKSKHNKSQSSATPKAESSNKMEQLKELKGLLNEGILTEEEFLKEKQKILSSK